LLLLEITQYFKAHILKTMF